MQFSGMAKKEPVNLKQQTIFALIPYLNLYAFYRIQKLRRYFLIGILITVGSSIIISVGIIVYAVLQSDSPDFRANVELIVTSIRSLPAYVIYFSSGILLNVYLIRKWSKKWNEQFSQTSVQQ